MLEAAASPCAEPACAKRERPVISPAAKILALDVCMREFTSMPLGVVFKDAFSRSRDSTLGLLPTQASTCSALKDSPLDKVIFQLPGFPSIFWMVTESFMEIFLCSKDFRRAFTI